MYTSSAVLVQSKLASGHFRTGKCTIFLDAISETYLFLYFTKGKE